MVFKKSVLLALRMSKSPPSSTFQILGKGSRIAGIVVGAILVLFIIIFLGMFLYEYRKG